MPNARNHGPAFTGHDAERIAYEFYRLHTTARPLPGERDYNFYLKTSSGEEYVLKIAHADERRELLDMQHQALEHLAKREPSLVLPQV
ncbi:MAG TPA: phosphotransferase, partial [Ktedonobacterales bacterium]|nr:phosphotransferase [Ktedonobacterales bacterium]